MAQQTADEEIANARATANATVREAEIRADRLIADAEIESKRMAEAERRRVDEEIGALAVHRDQLRSDVELLGRFESDYRDRLARAIEADLAVVRGRGSAAPSSYPALSDDATSSAGRRDDTWRAASDAPILIDALDEEETPAVGPQGSGERTEATVADSHDDAVEPLIVRMADEELHDDELRDAQPDDAQRDDVPVTASGANGTGRDYDAGGFDDDEDADVATVLAQHTSVLDLNRLETRTSEPASDTNADAMADVGSRRAAADVPPSPPAGYAASAETRRLPDESFYESLRDAVSDDAPLEPGEERFFDAVAREPGSLREMFRRKK
jgi:hypothetical protein